MLLILAWQGFVAVQQQRQLSAAAAAPANWQQQCHEVPDQSNSLQLCVHTIRTCDIPMHSHHAWYAVMDGCCT
jgi:hypothetical protein